MKQHKIKKGKKKNNNETKFTDSNIEQNNEGFIKDKNNIHNVKKLQQENDTNADNMLDKDKKKFRTFTGFIVLVLLIGSIVFGNNVTNQNDIETVKKGVASGIEPGTQMVDKDQKLEAKDYVVNIEDNNGGSLELSIWDYADEDGDYVQVFIDGVPKTDPFSITHKTVRVKVPSKGLIQVKGIRDGKDNGISYAVFFNKTGETYFNTVPLNATNTYTIKTTK